MNACERSLQATELGWFILSQKPKDCSIFEIATEEDGERYYHLVAVHEQSVPYTWQQFIKSGFVTIVLEGDIGCLPRRWNCLLDCWIWNEQNEVWESLDGKTTYDKTLDSK